MSVPHRALASATALVIALAVTVAPLAQTAEAATWPPGTYRVALDVTRLAGADRYETSVAIARSSFPGWAGVSHVIVASGEDRALADPLAAASLCWAYDAPLLLVDSKGVPGAVRTALAEMRSVSGTVTVTVVGGPTAVPAKTIAALGAIVGSGNVRQPWTTGDRYTTAAGIARLASEVASDTARVVPAKALVVNGTDSAGLVDALAASAVSARTGIPILPVMRDRVPSATAGALAALGPGEVIVLGGSAVVSDAVYAATGATVRWAGVDRYGTAVTAAGAARTRGWLTGDAVGLASTVPDALTGSIDVGRSGGPLLHVQRSAMGRSTGVYLHGQAGAVTKARLYGGTAVLTDALAAEVRGAPTRPLVVAPSAGARVAKRARVAVASGANTSEIRVYIGSRLIASKACSGYVTVDLGTIETPPAGSSYRVVAISPEDVQSDTTATYPLHQYPARTSIVIDKSDFRLYFFKDDVFVKSYPVAIGRTNAETPVAIWRIDSKYYTDPNGIYGPRKMRMYRKVGSSYVYTAYNIHGTNQPWVIGTKASAGCIRMYNHDVLDLYPRVPLGTIVQTRL